MVDDTDEDLLAFMRKALGLDGGAASGKPTTTGVTSSAEFIYDNAVDVALDMRSTKAAAEHIYISMKKASYSTQTWSLNPLHPNTQDVKQVTTIFLIDLLNFSFWSGAEKKEDGYAIEYKGTLYRGYMSLLAAIKRAIDDEIPILDPNLWIDEDEMPDSVWENIFRSETAEPLPMIKERIACIREAGEILLEVKIHNAFRFDGCFANAIEEANGSAVDLVNLLVDEFPCFRDVATFEGRTVNFYKRAQILVADIWASFNGESFGDFDDISTITMFADYRVPVILHYFGCLTYSPILEHHIRQRRPVPPGHRYEAEIRGCTIQCVEMIRREIVKNHPEEEGKINAILIDFFLYDEAKAMESKGEEMIMPHRTRSIWY